MEHFKNALGLVAPALAVIFVVKWGFWANDPNNIVFNAPLLGIPIWMILDAIAIVALLVAVFKKSSQHLEE